MRGRNRVSQAFDYLIHKKVAGGRQLGNLRPLERGLEPRASFRMKRIICNMLKHSMGFRKECRGNKGCCERNGGEQ